MYTAVRVKNYNMTEWQATDSGVRIAFLMQEAMLRLEKYGLEPELLAQTNY